MQLAFMKIITKLQDTDEKLLGQLNFYQLIKEHYSKQYTYIHKFKANFTAVQTPNYFLKLNRKEEENAKYCNLLITFTNISE